MCIQCLILLDSEHCSRWGVCVVKKLLPSKTEGSMCDQGLGMGRFWYNLKSFIFYKSELFKVFFTVFFLYILLNIYSYLIINLVNLNKEYS